MPYEFLEDEAIADIAFKAWGRSLEETFVSAADATMNVMVEDLDSIRPDVERIFKLENDALDLLLFDLLQEIVYYKDSEQLLLRIAAIEIETQDGRSFLEATARGERLDPGRHRTRVDVKAVTLHRFRLEKTERGWEAFVILDV
jgi:SHS2 domain-containing protein